MLTWLQNNYSSTLWIELWLMTFYQPFHFTANNYYSHANTTRWDIWNICKKHAFLLLSQNGCIMQCSVTTWIRYPTWLPLADFSATECGGPDSWSEPPLALQPRSLPSSLLPPAPSPPAAVGTGGKTLQPCLCLGSPGSKNTMYSIQMLKTKMCVHVITVHDLIVVWKREG